MTGARAWRRLLREERGSVVVELAIVLTLLLVVVFGIVDIGRAYYTQSALTAAAREGARYASAQVPSPPAPNDTGVINRVKRSFTRLGGRPGDTVTVTIALQPSPSNLQTIRVDVSFPFAWITPIQRIVGRTWKNTLTATASYRWEGAS